MWKIDDLRMISPLDRHFFSFSCLFRKEIYQSNRLAPAPLGLAASPLDHMSFYAWSNNNLNHNCAQIEVIFSKYRKKITQPNPYFVCMTYHVKFVDIKICFQDGEQWVEKNEFSVYSVHIDLLHDWCEEQKYFRRQIIPFFQNWKWLLLCSVL